MAAHKATPRSEQRMVEELFAVFGNFLLPSLAGCRILEMPLAALAPGT